MNSKLNGIYSKDVRTSFCFSFRALEYYIGGYICAHFAKGKEGFSSNLFMFNWFKSGSLSQGQHFPLKQHFASVVNMMISVFLTCILCALCGCVRGGCRHATVVNMMISIFDVHFMRPVRVRSGRVSATIRMVRGRYHSPFSSRLSL